VRRLHKILTDRVFVLKLHGWVRRIVRRLWIMHGGCQWAQGLELWDWSRNVLGDLEKRLKQVRKAVEACRKSSLSQHNVAREEILKYMLERLEE
jgi:hypothetical protein